MAHVMSAVMVDHNRVYSNHRKQEEGETWWNNFGTLIGSMFVGDEEKKKSLRLAHQINFTVH
jgi:hypothetical protein